MARHEVKRAPFECPNCGAQVPGDSLVCPECGSDEETGWSEDTVYDGVDFPDVYGDEDPKDERRTVWIVVTIAVVVLLVLFFMFVRL